MDYILFFLSVILMLLFLIWFAFGIGRWNKIITLVIDVLLILLCVGIIIFICVKKNDETTAKKTSTQPVCIEYVVENEVLT